MEQFRKAWYILVALVPWLGEWLVRAANWRLLRRITNHATGANGDLVIQSRGSDEYGTRPTWSSVAVTSTLLKFDVYQLH